MTERGWRQAFHPPFGRPTFLALPCLGLIPLAPGLQPGVLSASLTQPFQRLTEATTIRKAVETAALHGRLPTRLKPGASEISTALCRADGWRRGALSEATWHPLGHLFPDLPLNEQNIVENAIHNPAAVKQTVNDRPLVFVFYSRDPRLCACRQKVSDHPRLECLGSDDLS